MTPKCWRVFLLCLTTLLSTLFSAVSYGQMEVNAPPLRIGLGFSIPPWVIRDIDGGIELDILREAFALEGYQAEPVYMAFSRVYDAFGEGELDGIVNALPGATQRGFFSEPVVTFQNYAISLKKKGFPENIAIDFLRDKHVVGFQQAHNLLGDEFRSMSRMNERYLEIAKQAIQINLLFVREVDFVVMDRSIFGYYWLEALESGSRHQDHYKQQVTFHPLFKPSDYSFVFAEKEIRDAFDRGLRAMRESGRYQEILNKYDALKDLYGKPFQKLPVSKAGE